MNAAGRSRIGSSGLTALELVVVSSVFSIMTALAYGTFRTQTLSAYTQTAQSSTQANLRIWLARMAKDIRRAGYDPKKTGTFGIQTWTSTTFTFTTDANSDGMLASGPSENVGYKFADGSLYLWLGGTSWRPLITGIGGLTFTYRDVQGRAVSTVKQDVAQVEIALAAQASTASYSGSSAAAAPTPVVSIGSSRTTVTVPGAPSATMPILTQVEKVSIRNWQ